VSIADKYGLDTQRQHWKKAEVAEELHARGVVPHGFSDILRLLNEGRKVATYEGDEPDLEGKSLEDIAADVENRGRTGRTGGGFMTTATGMLDHHALSADAWERRLRADRERIERLLPDALRELHGVVVARAQQVGARALILSGSTARGRRTEISDLDYHLVGNKIATRDLSSNSIFTFCPQKNSERRSLTGTTSSNGRCASGGLPSTTVRCWKPFA
jgi:hypothetical protein